MYLCFLFFLCNNNVIIGHRNTYCHQAAYLQVKVQWPVEERHKLNNCIVPTNMKNTVNSTESNVGFILNLILLDVFMQTRSCFIIIHVKTCLNMCVCVCVCVCVCACVRACVTDLSLLQYYIKLGHTHTHHNCTPFYFCHSKI